ncbi:MAG TPA: sugar transferase [Longimicrobiales bacterium]|nr:sugar transferase [Longimicrobiales bacterium]
MQLREITTDPRLETFPVPPRTLPAGYERRRTRRRTGPEKIRRAVNVLVASVAIVLTAPLMLVVALLVKLTSRGPVIYTQPRVGLNRRRRAGPWDGQDRRSRRDTGGRVFTIYKFRTMRCFQTETLDGEGAQVWATRDDPRITPIGSFLRATRLDELPQLFNVLKGDMNIVGPRPEQPEIFVDLSEEVQGYRDRQKVLPGITGWAQVNHGYDESLDDVRKKVELDLEYIDRRSAVEDLVIMAKTVPVVVFRKVWR